MQQNSTKYAPVSSFKSHGRLAFTMALFVLLQCFVFLSKAQDEHEYLPPKFQNLTLNDGLSNLDIHTICQDDLGYIWIGTARGLNRYDGISFKHYFFDESAESLLHDNIIELHRSPDGNIFCSTTSGISIFDIEKEKFTNLGSKSTGFISFINFDSVVYGVSRLGGIFRFNEDHLEIDRVENFPPNLKLDKLINIEESGFWGKASNNQYIINYDPIEANYEKYILPDSDTLTSGGTITAINQHLIIATNSGITIFNVENKQFENLSDNFSGLEPIRQKTIDFIQEVEKDIVWIGTKTDGLYIYHLRNQTLTNHLATTEANTLNSNSLTYIFKDRTNNIWLATFDRGVAVAFESRKNFNFDLVLHEFTKNKFITAITSNNDGIYYIGTRREGLYMYDSKTKNTRKYNQQNSFIGDNHVRSLFLSSNNKLWIGGEKQLQLLDLNTQRHKNISIPRPNNGVVSLCESNNRIFAGTDLQGLLVFSLEGELQETIRSFGRNITQVLAQKNGHLFICSHSVSCFDFDYKNNKSVNLKSLNPFADHNLAEAITCYTDSEENLWIGSFKHGLYRMSRDRKKVDVFTMGNGLPSNDITGIIEDNYKNLWISTAYGLSMINDEGSFTNYSYNEGLENIQFHQKAALKDEYGTLFFGGNFGLTFFNPSALDLTKTQAPEIILETLKVSNSEVKPGDATDILDRTFSLTEEIILDHHYPDFSIEFKGFDYVAAKDLKYAYKLEGFNDEWNYVNNRTFASYQHLQPGNYTFKVIAQNNNGAWSKEPATLKIKIKPAPWLTTWAIFGYILALMLLSIGAFRFVLNLKLYKKELEIEHKERLREKEISKMKLRFFTNISHEIRTPVTLIKGNVDYLRSELKHKNIQLKATEGLKNSTDRLLRLVDQLLSFRLLENDALDMDIKDEDIVAITNKMVNSFRYSIADKFINLSVLCDLKELIVPLDKDKYEKILANLISNSLKFSNKDGFIRIVIEECLCDDISKNFDVQQDIDSYVKISVIDNGKGIPQDKLPYVFDRFFHSKTKKEKSDYSGSGIGLHFTKRLVDLHNGSIKASSIENKKTCFTIILPGREKNTNTKSAEIQSQADHSEPVKAIIPEAIQSDDRQRTILLAEDDIELNRFIKEALSDSFNVVTSFNGKEALELIKEQLPDIIISDIMMPEMDGISLCKSIREDDVFSHIPIVLLTAKAEVENKILGFEHGADEYLTKPFELDVLKARIHNLIRQRDIQKEYYKKAMPVEFKAEHVNQFEINFMKKVSSIVEENFSNSEFNVQQLAENMHMSRTSFYRKFMNITDSSPKDYITNFRINKSIEFIHEGYENFGEISYMCGFSSQSIFSIAFKKVKGISPLKYKKEIK